jgi:hypothetical protein
MYAVRLLTGVLVALLFAGGLSAQSVGASIQGIVEDTTGAAVPGATLVVRNVSTGDSRELLSDERGRYHVPLLPPGDTRSRRRCQDSRLSSGAASDSPSDRTRSSTSRWAWERCRKRWRCAATRRASI